MVFKTAILCGILSYHSVIFFVGLKKVQERLNHHQKTGLK